MIGRRNRLAEALSALGGILFLLALSGGMFGVVGAVAVAIMRALVGWPLACA